MAQKNLNKYFLFFNNRIRFMPRHRLIIKKSINPDPKYADKTISKLINILMNNGKKSTAENIVYSSLEKIEKKTKEDPLKIFKKALENVKPSVEVRSRRVGGANYQVPIEVRSERQTALGLRWIRNYARARTERSMINKLTAEILDASKNRGASCKRKDDTHKMAEANKAFAHYRW